MFLYESVSCLPVSAEPVLFYIYVWTNVVHMFWMAPGKISYKLTGSQSLNKVFELKRKVITTRIVFRVCFKWISDKNGDYGY